MSSYALDINLALVTSIYLHMDLNEISGSSGVMTFINGTDYTLSHLKMATCQISQQESLVFTRRRKKDRNYALSCRRVLLYLDVLLKEQLWIRANPYGVSVMYSV